jgi:hypothetical protein
MFSKLLISLLTKNPPNPPYKGGKLRWMIIVNQKFEDKNVF